MASSLERRVERRFIEIEGRLRGQRMPQPINIPSTHVDEQFDKYEFYLNEIMRNVREARSRAPCSGCKKTVETIKITTLGALTALSIFKEMSSNERKRADFSDEEIQEIKKEVEERYANY